MSDKRAYKIYNAQRDALIGDMIAYTEIKKDDIILLNTSEKEFVRVLVIDESPRHGREGVDSTAYVVTFQGAYLPPDVHTINVLFWE